MARGLNQWVGAGNVADKILYSQTKSGVPVCTFAVVCDRKTKDSTVTARIKVNAYGKGLVGICEQRLTRGIYVVVEGELMNRDGATGELLEVRAHDIIFPSRENGEKENG